VRSASGVAAFPVAIVALGFLLFASDLCGVLGGVVLALSGVAIAVGLSVSSAVGA
jgi:hypothetical protein